jgi:hypothetical protein
VTVQIVTGPDQGDASAVILAAELQPDRLVLDIVSVIESEPSPGMVDGQPGRLEVLDDLPSRRDQGRQRRPDALVRHRSGRHQWSFS